MVFARYTGALFVTHDFSIGRPGNDFQWGGAIVDRARAQRLEIGRRSDRPD